MLWPVLDSIFHLALRYDNSLEAVNQRQAFLRREKIGICDIVDSCKRDKIDASDFGMKDICLRNILAQIALHSTLHTLIFTGGNSKNGPEYLFRRQLKSHGLRLCCMRDKTPRIHRLSYNNREIMTISLTSPSNTANRAIGSSELYKLRKRANPAFSPIDFRIEQYKEVFLAK